MRHYTIIICFIVLLFINSSTALFSLPGSNETYVVVNTLKFAATRSLEPTAHLAYGTLYLYMLLPMYAFMYLAGLTCGIYRDYGDFALQFFVNPSPFYVAGRILSAVFAAGNIFLTYVIGTRFLNSKMIGFLAALFLLLDKVHFMRAQAVLPDTAVTFFGLIFLYYALSILESRQRKDYILAGIAAGLIVGTKVNGAILLLCFPLVHLLSRDGISRNRLIDTNVISFGITAVVTLFIVHPYLFINFSELYARMLEETYKAGLVIKYPDETPYLWIFERFLKDNVVVGGMYIVGLMYAVYAATKGQRIYLILASMTVGFIVIVGSNVIHNIHFVLPVVPIFCLMAAGALYACTNMSRNMIPTALVLCGVIVGAGASANRLWAYAQSSVLASPQQMARDWIEGNISMVNVIAMDSYEDGPQIFTLERFFSPERLQDYRGYVPDRIRERLEEYASTNGAYSTIRVKYYHPQPVWPKSFSGKQIERFTGNGFMERKYRLHWRTLAELRTLGVSYIVTSRNLTVEERGKYPKEHLLYAAHQRMVTFYETLGNENGVVEMARFGDITVYRVD